MEGEIRWLNNNDDKFGADAKYGMSKIYCTLQSKASESLLLVPLYTSATDRDAPATVFYKADCALTSIWILLSPTRPRDHLIRYRSNRKGTSGTKGMIELRDSEGKAVAGSFRKYQRVVSFNGGFSQLHV